MGEMYDDGNWTAMTSGMFISLLVDAGHDPVAIFRVTKDHEQDEEKQFVREIELIMVPNNHVCKELGRLNVQRIHKTLVALINGGVVS